MRKLILAVTFTFLSLALWAQKGNHELALKMTPNFSTLPKFDSPVMGFGFGFAYNYNLGNLLAVESGVNYLMLNKNFFYSPWIAIDTFYDEPFPNRGIKSEGFVEIPIYFKIRLRLDQQAPFQIYLMSGYSFAFKVNEFQVEYYDDHIEFRSAKWGEEEDYAHFINLAIDLQYEIKQNFIVGLRPQIQIMQNFSWYEPNIENVLGLGLSISKQFAKAE